MAKSILPFIGKNILPLLVAVVSIVYFLPRDTKFTYLFEQGKPWKYNLLQAPFDFDVRKSESAYRQDADSVLKDYAPYYTVDSKTVEKALSDFDSDYERQLKNIITPAYYGSIRRSLQDVYQKGILSHAETQRLESEKVSTLYVVENRMANAVNTSQILTIKEAYDHLLNANTSLNKEKLSQCKLNNYLHPNLVFDSLRSSEVKKELLSRLSGARGRVINGQRIIDRGEIVTEETYDIIKSLEIEANKRGTTSEGRWFSIIGQSLFVLSLLFLFLKYLGTFCPDALQEKNKFYLLLLSITIFPVATSLVVSSGFLSVYLLPFAMVALIIKIFIDTHTSIITYNITILLCSLALKNPYDFLLLQFVAGLVAIYSLKELSQRSQLFRSALFIGISYFIVYTALEFIQISQISQMGWWLYLAFTISCGFLLLTYPLLLVIEKVFGFTSNVTLIELSNINNKLLSDLSEKAPGTFQHSMQVANIATAAANKIGAKSQLVRTGALYHDIGKVNHPVFFTENQTGVNPHAHLTYKQSAQIIINHVLDGLKLAEQHNLPECIKDFIRTHHGAGLTKYFYISYKNEHPDEEVDEADFRYPGPNPYTREQAIMMMADAVEAASRSLDEYTEEKINALVDKIVDGQQADGHFRQCPITFQEIDEVKTVFKEKLKIMYHTRISYPELKS